MNGLFDRTSVLPVILALGASMLLSFGLTPLVKRLAYRIGAVDVPKDRRRMHDHPIPRLGGLAIFVGFVIVTFQEQGETEYKNCELDKNQVLSLLLEMEN